MTIPKNPEERKDEIIQTAKRLFSERGYKATQVKDIVSEVGVAQGLFYYYFKSKEEVMEAVAEDYADKILEEIVQLTENKSKYLDKIYKIFDIFIEAANKENSLFIEIQTAGGGIIHERVLKALGKKIIPLVTKIAVEGNDSGEFNCMYPIQATQILVNGILETLNTASAQSRIEALCESLEAFQHIIAIVYGAS